MINGSRCYEMLQRLQNTNSRIVKEHIVREFHDQKEYWKLSLDPMTNYFVVIDPSVMSLPIGREEISDQHLELLKRLSTGYRGHEANKEINEALFSLGLKDRYILLTIVNKRPECGVSAKTIDKVFPGLLTSFSVQLAHVYKQGMNIFAGGKEWTISPKIDGLRGLYIDGKFYSRNGKEIPGLTFLATQLREVLPEGISLDGELTVPGKTFNELSGEIRSFKESRDVKYNVFDLHTAGMKSQLQERLCILHGKFSYLRANNNIDFVNHHRVTSQSQADNYYSMFVAAGYEGAMLKDPNGFAYNGRNKEWLKLKPSYTTDVIVTGVERGTGKYENAVGALIVDYNGKEVKVGSGLTDKQRSAWLSSPSLIVGKTIEVMYMEETEYGSLRHPRFKTVRGDK